jgi:hypothetical protein
VGGHLKTKRQGACFGHDPLRNCENHRVGQEKRKMHKIVRSGVDLKGEVLLASTEIDVEGVGAELWSDMG